MIPVAAFMGIGGGPLLGIAGGPLLGIAGGVASTRIGVGPFAGIGGGAAFTGIGGGETFGAAFVWRGIGGGVTDFLRGRSSTVVDCFLGESPLVVCEGTRVIDGTLL